MQADNLICLFFLSDQAELSTEETVQGIVSLEGVESLGANEQVKRVCGVLV